MILKKSFKNMLLLFLVLGLTACSTLSKNANKNFALKPHCIVVTPMTVGEQDTNILKTSSQVCEKPHDAVVWQQLAQQFFDQAKYDKAVQAANVALKLQPNNAEIKEIILRSGLKITGRGLDQMKGSMQFLYGDTWKDASKVASQINHSRGEKPLDVIAAPANVIFEPEVPKKANIRKSYPKKTSARKVVSKKTSPSTSKPANKTTNTSSKPGNPFSSFN